MAFVLEIPEADFDPQIIFQSAQQRKELHGIGSQVFPETQIKLGGQFCLILDDSVCVVGKLQLLDFVVGFHTINTLLS